MEKKKEKTLFEYYNFTSQETNRFPEISSILRKLTPEKNKKEIKKIQDFDLPTEIKKLVDKYEKIADRKDFIWKWSYLKIRDLTLDITPKRYRESLLVAKLSSIIINVLVDDIADKKKDRKMWDEAFNIFFFPDKFKKDIKNFSFQKKNYLNFIEEVRNFLVEHLQSYPEHKRFKELFWYDYRQFFNATLYGYLVNKRPEIINLEEHEVYFPPNMQIMIMLTIDMMACSKFNKNEIGPARELFSKIQKMGNIGNSITTFEREIEEEDFTSKIFTFLVSRDLIERKNLKKENKKEIIEKTNKNKIKKELLKEWERCYIELESYKSKIDSFDVEKIIKGAESLIKGHLISEGFK